jgi:lipoprotein-anchoring transpeptidase ErfK/SrfK
LGIFRNNSMQIPCVARMAKQSLRVKIMSGWMRVAANGLLVLLSVSLLADPALAGSKVAALPFAPPPGITLTDGHPSNALMLRAKVKLNPMFMRQVVAYRTDEKPGTLVVNTGQKFLYLVLGKGKAMRYGIGTAKTGFEWSGVHRISNKREWPDWTPPAEMRKRRPELPLRMEGGPNNPLGARALYIGSTLYRIHGTNEPWTIGGNVSSGCIRMVNEDVIDLFARVNVGTKVIIM